MNMHTPIKNRSFISPQRTSNLQKPIVRTAPVSVDSVKVSFKGYIEIENFQKVSEKLYRGAQPTNKGLRDLAKNGVKTIVNLRSHQKKEILKETLFAKLYGMKVVNLPISPGIGPSEEQMHQFFNIIDKSKGPVFVHCFQGQDRTGIMSALYRVKKENWPFEKAYQEMQDMGHATWEFPMLGTVLKRLSEHKSAFPTDTSHCS